MSNIFGPAATSWVVATLAFGLATGAVAQPRLGEQGSLLQRGAAGPTVSVRACVRSCARDLNHCDPIAFKVSDNRCTLRL